MLHLFTRQLPRAQKHAYARLSHISQRFDTNLVSRVAPDPKPTITVMSEEISMQKLEQIRNGDRNNGNNPYIILDVRSKTNERIITQLDGKDWISVDGNAVMGKSGLAVLNQTMNGRANEVDTLIVVDDIWHRSRLIAQNIAEKKKELNIFHLKGGVSAYFNDGPLRINVSEFEQLRNECQSIDDKSYLILDIRPDFQVWDGTLNGNDWISIDSDHIIARNGSDTLDHILGKGEFDTLVVMDRLGYSARLISDKLWHFCKNLNLKIRFLEGGFDKWKKEYPSHIKHTPLKMYS